MGVLRLTLDIPESQSLKEKRSVIRSLKDRIETRFRVAVAEVGDLDLRQRGELAIACVSNESGHAAGVLSRIAGFAESNAGDGVITFVVTEIIHVD